MALLEPPLACPDWCRPLRQRRGRRCQLSPAERRAKRGLDLVLCVLFAVPALALIGLTAIAIHCDSRGPALFAQWRLGAHGRRFRCWKLRTMIVNAAELKVTLHHLNEVPLPYFKITCDPRITRVGGFLRRTSLDELPQIWNVWRGEMSWVGPRPTDFGLDHYQLWHTERLIAPPGITGLWQIVARGESGFEQGLRLDLAYLRAWSVGLDLRILAGTVRAVLVGRGAK